MNSMISPVCDANFDQKVLGSNLPVVMFIWAEWNKFSKMMIPIIDDIADEYEGKVKITRLLFDDNESLAARFAICDLPAFLIFKDGAFISSRVGLRSKEEMIEFIDGAILTTS